MTTTYLSHLARSQPYVTDLRGLWSVEEHPLDTDDDTAIPEESLTPEVENDSFEDSSDEEDEPLFHAAPPEPSFMVVPDLKFGLPQSSPAEPEPEEEDDDLMFAPRLQDPDEEFPAAWLDETETTVEVTESTIAPEEEFIPDASPREVEPLNKLETCFASIQLLTADQDIPDLPPRQQPEERQEASLSGMIHAMDWSLLDDNLSVQSYRRFVVEEDDDNSVSLSVASCPAASPKLDEEVASPTSVLVQFPERKSSRLGSFRSSAKRAGRVLYNLGRGVKAMSKDDKKRSRSFLPPKRLNKNGPPPTRAPRDSQRFVLLADPATKIFEVVAVDVVGETTIGEVLAKARSLATDASLSQPHYTSLVSLELEWAAPMLPVRLLDPGLVAAVPAGHSAASLQHVLRVLGQHPRLQRYLQRADPASRPSRHERRQWKQEAVTPQRSSRRLS